MLAQMLLPSGRSQYTGILLGVQASVWEFQHDLGSLVVFIADATESCSWLALLGNLLHEIGAEMEARDELRERKSRHGTVVVYKVMYTDADNVRFPLETNSNVFPCEPHDAMGPRLGINYVPRGRIGLVSAPVELAEVQARTERTPARLVGGSQKLIPQRPVLEAQ